MIMYHGTSETDAQQIISNVDTSKGGGELGKGFYVGDLLHRACAWAWHKYKKDFKVVSFDINDNEFLEQDIVVLDAKEAGNLRSWLRKKNKKRTWEKGVAAIWAPVVGNRIPNFNQIKFEKNGELFINSRCNKVII